jgi:acylphosphatase
MSNKCVKITVTGEVQGVFFRKYAKITAGNLDIKGIVENQLDDTVYIEACGEEKNLEKFIEWCHKGPDKAKVDSVEVLPIEIRNFPSFSIVYF